MSDEQNFSNAPTPSSPPPPTPTGTPGAPPSKQTNVWLWVALALIGVIVLAAVAWYVGQGVEVPDVAGLTQTEATQRLNDAGLSLGRVSTVVSNTVPDGAVVAQDPAAGASARRGDTVALEISGGVAGVTVPGLQGKSTDEAEEELQGLGLVPVVTTQYNASVPADRVFGQVPDAGVEVSAGSTVVVLASKGAEPPSVQVPGVVGKTRSDAETAISAAGLKAVVYEVFNAAQAGKVIAQLPTAGSKVAPESEVQLAVSKGPGVGEVTVPNVTGQQESAAVKALEDAGLLPAVYRQFSQTAAKGVVIGQLPAAGTKTGAGSQVGVLVSLGPDTGSVQVPEVVGMTAEEASATLSAAGLVPRFVEDYSETVPRGEVGSQLPLPNSQVPPKSAVIAVVSKGPQPQTSP